MVGCNKLLDLAFLLSSILGLCHLFCPVLPDLVGKAMVIFGFDHLKALQSN